MAFFSNRNLVFIDSMQLMNSSLDKVVKNLSDEYFNPIQDRFFLGCSRIGRGEGGFGPPSLKSVTHTHISYNDETWNSFTLPKGDPNNI